MSQSELTMTPPPPSGEAGEPTTPQLVDPVVPDETSIVVGLEAQEEANVIAPRAPTPPSTSLIDATKAMKEAQSMLLREHSNMTLADVFKTTATGNKKSSAPDSNMNSTGGVVTDKNGAVVKRTSGSRQAMKDFTNRFQEKVKKQNIEQIMQEMTKVPTNDNGNSFGGSGPATMMQRTSSFSGNHGGEHSMSLRRTSSIGPGGVSNTNNNNTTNSMGPVATSDGEASVGMKRLRTEELIQQHKNSLAQRLDDEEERAARLRQKHDTQNAARTLSPTDMSNYMMYPPVSAMQPHASTSSSTGVSPTTNMKSTTSPLSSPLSSTFPLGPAEALAASNSMPSSPIVPCAASSPRSTTASTRSTSMLAKAQHQQSISIIDRKQSQVRQAMQCFATEGAKDTATQLRKVNSFDNTSSAGPIVFKSGKKNKKKDEQ